MKNIVIVGGGLLGLAAYKILKSINKNLNVKIIENQNEIGGLLRSIKIDNLFFDIGTHYLKETGNRHLDKILFSEIQKKWINLNYLNSGSFYNNKNEYNQFINLKEIKASNKIIKEIIKNKKKTHNSNELERCLEDYGNLLTKKIIEPKIIKLVGEKLKYLPVGFSSKFALGRFNLDNENEILKLKQNKKLDKIFSFKFNYQKVGNLKSFYPKKGGIGEYKNFFIKKNSKDIFLKNRIEKITIKNKKIIELFTNSGKIKPDYVIWTIDQVLFNNLNTKNKLTISKTKKKTDKFFYWNFVNITSNNSFRTKCYYMNILNPNMNLHRITLYKNIQKKGKNRATLEILSKKKMNFTSDSIIKDLKKIDLIYKTDRIKLYNNFSVKMKIPKVKQKKINNVDINNISFLNSGLFENKNQEEKLISLYNNIKKVLKNGKNKSNNSNK